MLGARTARQETDMLNLQARMAFAVPQSNRLPPFSGASIGARPKIGIRHIIRGGPIPEVDLTTVGHGDKK
jgi:hypothetical protein